MMGYNDFDWLAEGVSQSKVTEKAPATLETHIYKGIKFPPGWAELEDNDFIPMDKGDEEDE